MAKTAQQEGEPRGGRFLPGAGTVGSRPPSERLLEAQGNMCSLLPSCYHSAFRQCLLPTQEPVGE